VAGFLVSRRAVHTDAFEILGQRQPEPGFVLYTCEHASNRVPRPLRPRPADRRLLAMHWGYDIGAANVTRSLVRRDVGSQGVLSRFSRLLIDPNRDPSDPTAILHSCDEGAPTFNRHAVVAKRVARFHVPFHAALDTAIQARPRALVSIHSFTPVFRGNARAVEAGVLFDAHDDIALRLVETLRAEGFATEPNEPYSGKAGLIYSAARHGNAVACPYLEIELRQDLIATARTASAVAARVHRAILSAGI